MKRLIVTVLASAFCLNLTVNAQTYRHISGWSQDVNDQIEGFLNSTITMNIRKVAVFDSDGTTFGQCLITLLTKHSTVMLTRF